ncbi:Bestrophin, RFP-TM, chloride channel-domain-containing protein [Melanogaster broomeanus]|nr:Bestrophin, RFP-TM, chloride channel-domain-containing protein [Melanogaster broomeanus]
MRLHPDVPSQPSRPSTHSNFLHDHNGRPFLNAVLATALFRCWSILIFFGAWSTAICLISHNVHSLAIQSTLLTVFGTVLGFIISYRTTSSFERYNEGRRLWSQIVLGSRVFARTIWFHVPDLSKEERRARTLIEKKTIVNLLEAFGVAVKHYLRGEDGIYYTDLYPLVKFLPPYALPASIPSSADLPASFAVYRACTRSATLVEPIVHPNGRPQAGEKFSNGPQEDPFLLPASEPPKRSLFDLFPFSLLVKMLTHKGHIVKGKKAARLRARMGNQQGGISHNIPLEISLYLSSYISALQTRKAGVDAPTITMLYSSLNQLVDALTGLERILTTPIPFSSVLISRASRYSIHLWSVTTLYCLALPFQIWSTMKWLTIPATLFASFAFFGFLVAGEEIESYDKNDLNMDLFVHTIIRKELRAVTATPTPDPGVWAFSADNDLVLASRTGGERIQPMEWVRRGAPQMQEALAVY